MPSTPNPDPPAGARGLPPPCATTLLRATHLSSRVRLARLPPPSRRVPGAVLLADGRAPPRACAAAREAPRRRDRDTVTPSSPRCISLEQVVLLVERHAADVAPARRRGVPAVVAASDIAVLHRAENFHRGRNWRSPRPRSPHHLRARDGPQADPPQVLRGGRGGERARARARARGARAGGAEGRGGGGARLGHDVSPDPVVPGRGPGAPRVAAARAERGGCAAEARRGALGRARTVRRWCSRRRRVAGRASRMTSGDERLRAARASRRRVAGGASPPAGAGGCEGGEARTCCEPSALTVSLNECEKSNTPSA